LKKDRQLSNPGAPRRAAKKSQAAASPLELRVLVQENVRKMLQHRFGKKGQQDWVIDAGISLGTIGRTLRGVNDMKLSTLVEFADAVGLAPYQLLLEIRQPDAPPQVISDRERDEWATYLELKSLIAAGDVAGAKSGNSRQRRKAGKPG